VSTVKIGISKAGGYKENIQMQVLGLEWEHFAIMWSHKGMKRSVNKLAMHSKMIIREEKKLMPPTDPALEMSSVRSSLYLRQQHSNNWKAMTL
jgi:hypothetical protein